MTLRFLGEVTEDAARVRWATRSASRMRSMCRAGRSAASGRRPPGSPGCGSSSCPPTVSTTWPRRYALATAPVVAERDRRRAALQRPPHPGPGQGPAGSAGPGRAGGDPLRRRPSPSAHVDLVASTPSPQGHVYTTLVRAPLGGAQAVSQPGPPPRKARDGLGHGGRGRLLERGRDQQGGVGGVAHVAALDEHLGHRGEVEPGQVVAGLQAVDAVVVADRHGGAGGEGVAQHGGEGGRRRDDAVVRPVGRRLEHGEAAPARRAAVGVDVDRDVGVGVVDDGRPRRDAGPDARRCSGRVSTTVAPSACRSACR